MYILVYGSDSGNTFSQYAVLAKGNSLEDIIPHRKMAGDLVFNEHTKEIVKDTSWLFQWEKEKSDCYAQKQILLNKKLSGHIIFD